MFVVFLVVFWVLPLPLGHWLSLDECSTRVVQNSLLQSCNGQPQSNNNQTPIHSLLPLGRPSGRLSIRPNPNLAWSQVSFISCFLHIKFFLVCLHCHWEGGNQHHGPWSWQVWMYIHCVTYCTRELHMGVWRKTARYLWDRLANFEWFLRNL